MAVEGWKERAGRNEALFREVNDNIADLEERMGSGIGTLPVICECSRADCSLQLEIDREEYARVRQHPDRFVVARGHEQPSIEQQVGEGPDYVIVEKIGTAAEAAESAP